MEYSDATVSAVMAGDAARLESKRGDTAAARGTALDVVRGFGMMAGPSALFDLFLAGSVIAAARGALTRPRTRLARLRRPLVAAGTALTAAYPLILRPWMLRWGATAGEVRAALPGDELVPNPATISTRAITVNAPIEAVWPWLAQIGQDRGGFYSYEWLENLAGCQMRNADRIHPEWQQRALGDTVKLHPSAGCKVVAFEPNRAIVLEGWGAFVVEPLDARHTRVLLRSRTPHGWRVVVGVLLIDLPHFIMERKMLLGLKARAERAWSGAAGSASRRAPTMV